MNILGIQAFYHSHAAALLVDGELKYLLEEEKLRRVKAAREGFPVMAIAEALRAAGMAAEDVNEVAYPMDPWRYGLNLVREGLRSIGSLARPGVQRDRGIVPVSLFADRLLTTVRFTPPFLRTLLRHSLRFEASFGAVPHVVCVPHHAAHAAAAYYPSGFDEAAVLIADGMGELESTSIWSGKGPDLRRLESVAFPNSLGEFYAAFTEYCGFRSYSQEGKLMGLAAYGGPDADIERKMRLVIRIGDRDYRVDPKFTIRGKHGHSPAFSQDLVELFGSPRRADEAIDDRHKAIAFAAQQALEDAVVAMVRRTVELTGSRSLCFSGGVAMNCKVNGRILSSGLVDRLFVFPASNDSGAALGAALWRARAHQKDPRFRLQHAGYGTGFSDDGIEEALSAVKAPYRRLGNDRFDEIGRLLSAGKTVGIFSGRSEFGARALGARSILADARDSRMANHVNTRIKGREPWRPFAPMVLEGFEKEFFEQGQPSYFMMKTFSVRSEKRSVIPAVVHVDGTSRPQSVSRDANGPCYEILRSFYRLTGVPVLLNTSFNYRDEPIVARPLDALRCYFGTGIDALLIGPFLLRKS